MAGFTTGTNTAGTVVATATVAGNVADIVVKNSKFDNLAAAINAVSSQTGVTAANTSGAITLTSASGKIDLTGNTAADTGISGTLIAGTASNATTTRSVVTLSTGSSNGINVSGSTAAALTAAGLSEGSATVTTTAGAGISSLDLTTASGSQAALSTLDSAINTITDSRASMGAFQNRLTASISNLETTSMNLQASRSRILDTDYAKETTTLAKSQIISQAATAMLAQANQSGQSVLALLK
jgi:flagellin